MDTHDLYQHPFGNLYRYDKLLPYIACCSEDAHWGRMGNFGFHVTLGQGLIRLDTTLNMRASANFCSQCTASITGLCSPETAIPEANKFAATGCDVENVPMTCTASPLLYESWVIKMPLQPANTSNISMMTAYIKGPATRL